MTTATPPVRQHAAFPDNHLTFARVVRSEWIKFRTLRSTMWCFALIILLTVGFGFLLAGTLNFPDSTTLPADQQREFEVQAAVLGVNFTQLVAAVIGVLIISGEYATGMIRSTFAAVPTRLPALFAKMLVLGVTTFVVGIVSIFVTAILTAPILSGKGIDNHLTDSNVWLPMLGAAGYLALIAMLAFGIGAILRNSAGGIATSIGLVLVIPPVLSLVASLTQAKWIANVGAFLPSEAGGKLFAFASDDNAQVGGAASGSGTVNLDNWQGLLVIVAWVVVAAVVAAILVKRRDA